MEKNCNTNQNKNNQNKNTNQNTNNQNNNQNKNQISTREPGGRRENIPTLRPAFSPIPKAAEGVWHAIPPP